MRKNRNARSDYKQSEDYKNRAKEIGDIVMELCKGRNMTKLADQAGVTAAYMSEICKGKYVPSADVLKRIGKSDLAKQKGVTADDLMLIANYQSDSITDSIRDLEDADNPEGDDQESGLPGAYNRRVRPQMAAHERLERIAKGALYPVLNAKGYHFDEVEQPRMGVEHKFDMATACIDNRCIVRRWNFDFKCIVEDDERIRRRLLNICRQAIGRMVFAKPQKGYKVSLVISDPIAFEGMKEYIGCLSYKGDMSVILIDEDNIIVSDEYYLAHYDDKNYEEFLIV